MNVTIIGAGELGRLLAKTLLEKDKKNNVSILDRSGEELEKIASKLDVKTTVGFCTHLAKLKEAGAEKADVFLAVSGDESDNILACQIVAKLNEAKEEGRKTKTICRLYNSDIFEAIGKELFGIEEFMSPPESCAEKIEDVLDTPILQEIIRFKSIDKDVTETDKISDPTDKGLLQKLFSKDNFPVSMKNKANDLGETADISEAAMAVIRIDYNSSLVLQGKAIQELPIPDDIRHNIRFAAIIRKNKLIVPRGGIRFLQNDRVYVAGKKRDVDRFLKWLSFSNPDERISTRKLIIFGSGEIANILLKKLQNTHLNICVIEPDWKRCQDLQEKYSSNIIVLNGTPTEEDILEEAGIHSEGTVFVGISSDDENNILSCVLAKQLGAWKTICLTNKPEYGNIVSSMEWIDSGFSASLVSVNAILRHLDVIMRADIDLQRAKAHLFEYSITGDSHLCGQSLKSIKVPPELIMSLVFRGTRMIVPSGDTILQEHDRVVSIVHESNEKKINAYFAADGDFQ